MNNKIRRICLLGGAGCGKSITATHIKSQLGFKGYDIELVDEVIKDWTYVNRIPRGGDSLWLQSSQIQKEDMRLRAGVDLIVSDSPSFLQYFYAYWHKDPFANSMLEISKEMDSIYIPYYIFIERQEDFYDENGRYETLAQAKEIDQAIKNLMLSNRISFDCFSCLEQDKIVEHLIDVLGTPNERV